MTTADTVKKALTWSKMEKADWLEGLGMDPMRAEDDVYFAAKGFGGRTVWYEKGFRHIKQTVKFADGSEIRIHVMNSKGLGLQMSLLWGRSISE